MSKDIIVYSDRVNIRNIGIITIILLAIIIVGSFIIGFFSLLGFSNLSLNPVEEFLDFVRMLFLSGLLTIGLLIFLWIRGRT